VFCFLLLSVYTTQVFTKSRFPDTEPSPLYKQRAQSPGGIGKIYLGREIGRVMDHKDAAWLDRPSRESDELPDQVVSHMNLRAGDVVADIGAGTGYFTFRISPFVPEGEVLAVDIQPEMLEMIEKRRQQVDAKNVVPVLGSIMNPNLPQARVDVVLMVNSYHEFSHPREMMESIVRALKPGGRVIIIEYRGEDPSVAKQPLHKMNEAQARKEMAVVGLRWRETKDFLPQQHFMVFEKPK
jgi:ubiquinone/menaquinone biosynthesis C-methylase UbiE